MEKFLLFLTVGTQLPFDRLVEYAINFVNQHGHDRILLMAQVGKTSRFLNQSNGNIKFFADFNRDEYADLVETCDVFISHCGTGSVVSAISKAGKFIAVPREAKFGEHRNNHQIDTANSIEGAVQVARTQEEFMSKLLNLLDQPKINSDDNIVCKRFMNELDSEIRRLLFI